MSGTWLAPDKQFFRILDIPALKLNNDQKKEKTVKNTSCNNKKIWTILFTMKSLLICRQGVGHSCLLSGFCVTESADSEGLDDSTVLLKRSVSVICYSCYAFPSQISLLAYTSALFPAHSIKLIRLSQHEITSAIVILFSSSTDPLLSSVSSLSFNLRPRTASIISESVNVWETRYIIYM
jgi:hypothetical protein